MSLIFFWLAVLFVPTHNIYSHPVAPKVEVSSKDFSVFEENGKVGLKDEEGKILIPAAYDAIGWSNGKLSVLDKVVGYRSNGLWGLIHTSNRVMTPAEFLELIPGEGSFLIAQKRSPLSQRSAFGVITTSGKTVIPFQYDALKLSNMRAIVMTRSGLRYHFGLMDLSNKILIPLEYQRIYSLGSLRYAVENFADKTAIFADDGTQVTGFTIDSIAAFKKDFAVVYQNQRQGLIDRNGRLAIQPVHGGIALKADGTIAVRDPDTWIFLDGENNRMGELQADGIKPLSPNHYAVTAAGKIQLTHNDFKPLHAGYFSSLTEFHNGVALYRASGRTGVVSIEGHTLIPAEYENMVIDGTCYRASLSAGYRNRWVILDSNGKPVTEKPYQAVAAFDGKLYPVQNRNYWGAVDARGREIIRCVHDSLVQRKGQYVVVKFKGEYGIIDLDENWVVTPQPHPLRLLNDELYFQYADKTTFVKSLDGNILYFSENVLEFTGAFIREHLPTGAFWIIDMNGIIIDRSNQPDRTEKIFAESEGLRAIYKDGKYGFIDDEGRLRIANRYEEVKPFSEGMAAVRIRSRWGYINQEEKLVVQPVYDAVENFHHGYAIVTQDHFSGLIDQSGKIVIPFRYDEIRRSRENRFLLRLGRAYGLADARGTIIIHPRYDEVNDTGNGYVIAARGGKYGLLTLQGVSTIPMIYDDLFFDPHHRQYVALKKATWNTVRLTAP